MNRKDERGKMKELSGKVGLITGAGKGSGGALARALAERGAIVAANDISPVNVEGVVDEIVAQGGRVRVYIEDVAKKLGAQNLVKQVEDEFGRLDIQVNNAGVILYKKIEDTSLAEWRWLMSVNLDGVFLGTKFAIETMRKSGGGSIINIASVAGLIGNPDAAAYHASKGGVRSFTKAAAIECSKAGYGYNIRINSIYPGVINTKMADDLRNDEAKYKIALGWHAMGHFGEPEDVAYGVLYLASDESKFMTGSELVIDGGWTAR